MINHTPRLTLIPLHLISFHFTKNFISMKEITVRITIINTIIVPK
jgi:hypothetical protein